MLGAPAMRLAVVLGLVLSVSPWANGADQAAPAAVASAHAQAAPLPGLNAPASLALNGATAYAEVGPSPDLNVATDWTVELWLKDADPNGFLHDLRYVLNKGDGLALEAPFLPAGGPR